MRTSKYLLWLTLGLVLFSCKTKDENKTLFELMNGKDIGIDFHNDLTYDQEFNVYKYRNFYNGGGVAIGDINNDGLVDVYLSANQTPNRLYLNKGDFKFEDITENAKVGGTKAWSTGVSMVDINADGLLDIYVCNSGDVAGDNKQNELFVNNGDLTFTESAEAYGLDDLGFSTHASFFDFDKDGDLDVYLLNNSYQAIGSFNLQRNERPKRDILGGDKLMENVDGNFIDISEKAGIYGSVIGFGLGVTVGDVNNDNWEDIFVSNDFFERDYLYINQQDGTFKESLTEQMMSISGASMGADMADINNDGHNDLFVTEMLPSEYERLKTVTTFEDWNKYQYKLKNGYYHQFTRNTLQLNNGNETFSEIGRLSGVEASDWSWGALFFDMDNDGFKDLFIANGIYRDLTDQDYLQYISNEEVIKSIVANNEVDYKKLIDIIPSNKVKNHAYLNQGNLKFRRTSEIGLDTPSFSNGAAYGDLDNDGDLDLIVNNVNMPLFVYRNNASSRKNHNHLKLVLKGEGNNTNAIGAKIKVKGKDSNYFLEQQPIRGFQSSMDLRPHFGLGDSDSVTIEIQWPLGKRTLLSNVAVNRTLTLNEKDAKSPTDSSFESKDLLFTKSGLDLGYKHVENRFVDFHRDRLLAHMMSTEGPKLSVGDINNDGLDDIFIGGSKDNAPTLLLGHEDSYKKTKSVVFEKNKNAEDAGSTFFDADNDGDLDLYVCSGGVEFSQFSSAYNDRLYINDSSGNFELSKQQLPSKTGHFSTSVVKHSDIDKDGDMDLFVGVRSIPGKYGVPGSGFILQNDGAGNFSDVTESVASGLKGIGMITDAIFTDINGNGSEELVVIGEFMGVEIFVNTDGKFTRMSDSNVSDLKGWWNTIHPLDLDGDGDMDFIIGNHGKNSRFKASKEYPIKLYSKDFDNNGFNDPILTFKAENGKEYPFALRHHLIDQIKSLKKKFPDYESFKDADINALFAPEDLSGVVPLEVNTLSTIYLINQGDLSFKIQEMPMEVQFTPIYAIGSADFDNDGDQDVIMGGNLFSVKPEVGRYDASFGMYLENMGNSQFKYHRDGAGFSVKGEIRDLKILGQRIFVSRNNDSLAIYNYGNR